jgi:hypothetical protein
MTPRKAAPMSIGKKFAHKAEAVKGNMKQAGAKVKDAVKH